MRPRSMNHPWLVLMTLTAAAVLLAAFPAAAAGVPATDGYTERVTVNPDGGQSLSSSSCSAMSDDGRYVAFVAEGMDGAYGMWYPDMAVFLRDRLAGTTVRVSPPRSEGEMWMNSVDISADGRYVVARGTRFSSRMGDVGSVMFVFDAVTGEREWIPVKQQEMYFESESACAISADGRYVAYTDQSTPTMWMSRQVWVLDRQADAAWIVSVDSDGDSLGDVAGLRGISADGHIIAFDTYAYTSGSSSNDVYIKDITTGRLDSLRSASAALGGIAYATQSVLSGDSRYVIAKAVLGSPFEPIPVGSEVFIAFDREEMTVEQLELGQDVRTSSEGGLATSADGRYVAVRSTYGADGYPPLGSEILVFDRESSDVQVFPAGSSYDSWGYSGAALRGISSDGRQVLFQSDTGLVPDDTNHHLDAFIHVSGVESETGVGVDRVAGADRYATAVEASRLGFPDGADTVVIATGTNWPDALGGSALAGAVEGPLLLTRPSGLERATAEEIERLGAKSAYILGGIGALSPDVEAKLKDMLGPTNVRRLAGYNRYGTALAVARRAAEVQGDAFSGEVFVATGATFPDALAASSVAAARKMPVLLADPAVVDVPLVPGTTDAVLLGGRAAVSRVKEASLSGRLGVGHVTRLGGADRYATAALITEWGVEHDLSIAGIGLCTGQDFPDALAGGPALGHLGVVMQLTPRGLLYPPTRALLDNKAEDIGFVRILGGPAAVNSAVETQVRYAMDR